MCVSVNIHFLFVFLAGAGGDTITGGGLNTSDDLPGAEGVISLLLRFGGATGAGAGSDTVGFDVAAAPKTRSIRMGNNKYTEFNLMYEVTFLGLELR